MKTPGAPESSRKLNRLLLTGDKAQKARIVDLIQLETARRIHEHQSKNQTMCWPLEVMIFVLLAVLAFFCLTFFCHVATTQNYSNGRTLTTEYIRTIINVESRIERQIYSDKNGEEWKSMDKLEQLQFDRPAAPVCNDRCPIWADAFVRRAYPTGIVYICEEMWCQISLPSEANIIHVTPADVAGQIAIGTNNSCGFLLQTVKAATMDLRFDTHYSDQSRTADSMSPVVVRATRGISFSVTSAGNVDVPSRLPFDGRMETSHCFELNSSGQRDLLHIRLDDTIPRNDVMQWLNATKSDQKDVDVIYNSALCQKAKGDKRER